MTNLVLHTGQDAKFALQWKTLIFKMRSLLFCIHHWLWSPFITDTNLLLKHYEGVSISFRTES